MISIFFYFARCPNFISHLIYITTEELIFSCRADVPVDSSEQFVRVNKPSVRQELPRNKTIFEREKREFRGAALQRHRRIFRLRSAFQEYRQGERVAANDLRSSSPFASNKIRKNRSSLKRRLKNTSPTSCCIYRFRTR